MRSISKSMSYELISVKTYARQNSKRTKLLGLTGNYRWTTGITLEITTANWETLRTNRKTSGNRDLVIFGTYQNNPLWKGNFFLVVLQISVQENFPKKTELFYIITFIYYELKKNNESTISRTEKLQMNNWDCTRNYHCELRNY